MGDFTGIGPIVLEARYDQLREFIRSKLFSKTPGKYTPDVIKRINGQIDKELLKVGKFALDWAEKYIAKSIRIHDRVASLEAKIVRPIGDPFEVSEGESIDPVDEQVDIFMLKIIQAHKSIRQRVQKFFSDMDTVNEKEIYQIQNFMAEEEFQSRLDGIIDEATTVKPRILETGQTRPAIKSRLEVSEEIESLFYKAYGQIDFIEIVGKDGKARNYKIPAYVKMLGRTRMIEAGANRTIQTAKDNGLDLLRFSRHSDACNICAPYQGRIYSISGSSEEYPPLDTGPRIPVHPNCEHNWNVVSRTFLEYEKKRGFPTALTDEERDRLIALAIREDEARESPLNDIEEAIKNFSLGDLDVKTTGADGETLVMIAFFKKGHPLEFMEVGRIKISTKGNRIVIVGIEIKKEFRGKGVGQYLMDQVRSYFGDAELIIEKGVRVGDLEGTYRPGGPDDFNILQVVTDFEYVEDGDDGTRRARYTAFFGREKIGHLDIEYHGGQIVVKSIYINPEYRGKGIAELLLKDLRAFYPKKEISIEDPEAKELFESEGVDYAGDKFGIKPEADGDIEYGISIDDYNVVAEIDGEEVAYISYQYDPNDGKVYIIRFSDGIEKYYGTGMIDDMMRAIRSKYPGAPILWGNMKGYETLLEEAGLGSSDEARIGDEFLVGFDFRAYAVEPEYGIFSIHIEGKSAEKGWDVSADVLVQVDDKKKKITIVKWDSFSKVARTEMFEALQRYLRSKYPGYEIPSSAVEQGRSIEDEFNEFVDNMFDPKDPDEEAVAVELEAPEYRGHIYNDGKVGEIGGGYDHRSLPIEYWYSQNVMTYHIDRDNDGWGDLTLRCNMQMTWDQSDLLNKIELINNVHMDVYGEGDKLAWGGTIQIYGDKVGTAVRNKIKQLKAQGYK